MAFPAERLWNPLLEVRGDWIYVIECFGARPGTRGIGWFSKVATSGLHLIIPGSSWVGSYTTNQFKVYLFRHIGVRTVPANQRTEEKSVDDFIELDLGDGSVKASADVMVRIKGTTLEEKAKSVLLLHYNAEDQDPRQAADTILSPHFRREFEAHATLIAKVNENTQISKMSSTQILKGLGLIQIGDKVGLDPNANEEAKAIGTDIITQLELVGLELCYINNNDFDPNDDFKNARNRLAKAKADGEADIATAEAKKNVVVIENQTTVLRAEGLRNAIEELLKNKDLSSEQAYRAVVEIPGLQNIVGDKDKFITEGGLTGLLAMLQSK